MKKTSTNHLYSADKSLLNTDDPCFDFDHIRKQVASARNNTEQYANTIFSRQLGAVLTKGFFSLDGSVISSNEEFTNTTPDYFKKSRRAVYFRGKYHLRGVRYTISANPTFELRQKLDTFKEDFYDGLDAIKNTNSHKFQIAIADYIKNAILTLYNSFLYEEKVGKYKFENLTYQALRKEGQIIAQAAVDFFYGLICKAQQLSNDGFRAISERTGTFDKLLHHILSEYEKGTFSSRHITRPEAAHPLVISSAAIRYALNCETPPDTIVGLPAGSTELSFAHATAQRLISRRLCNVLLFPVSLHSIKHDFDNQSAKPKDLSRFTKHHVKSFKDKNVVIIDDNSSTGTTVEMVNKAILLQKPNNIEVAIAEADVIRSFIAKNDNNRPNIATTECYKYSVNILPVSKSRYPKTDLRELFEKKKMIRCIKSRYFNSVPKSLVGAVYIDLINNRTEAMLDKLKDSDTIRSFRKTFLSNFHEVEVFYRKEHFSSVEHAYQAMKFEDGVLESVSDEHIEHINHHLQKRNTSISHASLPTLFTDPSLTAGTSKVAANQLRILGYVRKDWDNVKIDIMTDLLIQKFSQKTLYDRLKNTGDKYLIEGNDWNDTFWGECEGRGRNVLGRLLMTIRNTDYALLAKTATKIKLSHKP
ncbi:NADAR domain-containing protein [Sneathiella glossodoripedis]|uniref:NADAR domain-containing protein n=1 Tax=Sneathiella glossodoripedis TaxID=418853 RepID=UPI000472D118|nr:NADAR domain-containing protein [Sneathiella glossodoripedis]